MRNKKITHSHTLQKSQTHVNPPASQKSVTLTNTRP